MDTKTQIEIEAAVFRRLLKHLDSRKDVQNIDLMIHGGFCRNCLANWYADAASEAGVPLDKDTARERVYSMPYDEYKAKFQTPASEQQLAAMQVSVAKNSEV